MKRILILFLVLAVSITAFSVCSVSAADGRFFTFKPSFDYDGGNASYLYRYFGNGISLDILNGTNSLNYTRLVPTEYDTNFAMFEFTVNENNGIGGEAQFVFPMGQSSLSGTTGDVVHVIEDDTLFLEEGRFYLEFDTELDAFVKARFTLRGVNNYGGTQDVFGTVYAKTPIFDIYVSSGTKPYFNYERLDFSVLQEFDTPVFLCLELQFTTANALELKILYIDDNDGKVYFGGGSSPNNPIYPPADGGNVGNLDNAEQELIGSQQQGLDNTGTVIGNAENVILDLNTDLQLGSFVMALNPILDKITTIAGIDALVNMSLALGLFASLLSLSASIIGAGDKRASTQRKKDKNGKSATADKYADKGGGD
ncbi:MAG: hypothetical protein II215_00115 [Paludibacteraceae bacterium]|nr:hypothetical protein [Paludibacteraceae bacterium]